LAASPCEPSSNNATESQSSIAFQNSNSSTGLLPPSTATCKHADATITFEHRGEAAAPVGALLKAPPAWSRKWRHEKPVAAWRFWFSALNGRPAFVQLPPQVCRPPGRKQLVQQSPIFVAAAVTSLEEINLRVTRRLNKNAAS